MGKIIGYMVTWTTYGTRLQGDKRGYVKGGEILQGNENIREICQRLQKQPAVILNADAMGESGLTDLTNVFALPRTNLPQESIMSENTMVSPDPCGRGFFIIVCPCIGENVQKSLDNVRSSVCQPVNEFFARHRLFSLHTIRVPEAAVFSAPQFRQFGVDFIEVELFGVEFPAYPFDELLVSLVLGVFKGFEHVIVAPDAAAVVGRAGEFALEAHRVIHTLSRRADLDHLDLVVPTVAEVVLIDELALDRRGQFAEPCFPFILGVFKLHSRVAPATLAAHILSEFVPLFAVYKSSNRSLGRLGPRVADDKLMQVRVGPAHNDLDDLVQVAQLYVAWHGDTPPDGRLAPEERDFEFVDLCRLGRLRAPPASFPGAGGWCFRHISLLFCVSLQVPSGKTRGISNFIFTICDFLFTMVAGSLPACNRQLATDNETGEGTAGGTQKPEDRSQRVE